MEFSGVCVGLNREFWWDFRAAAGFPRKSGIGMVSGDLASQENLRK